MDTSRILAAAICAVIGVLAVQSSALAAGPSSGGASSGGSAGTVGVAAALSALRLAVTDVVGGTSVTGTVTLTSAAPPGGFLVTLSSDNTDAATVPASIRVAAGATSATFVVTTAVLVNSQSADIIGIAGAVTTYSIITVRPQFQYSNGSIAIIPGGNGSGTITSQPAGINCVIGATVTGTCSAFFPTGTVVRLTAKAAAGSKFQGWRGLPGCADPTRITVSRGSTINCQPSFTAK
jgi:hypothetical protein